jgi:hypothetical protein
MYMSDSISPIWALFWHFNAIHFPSSDIAPVLRKLSSFFTPLQVFCKRIYATKPLISLEIRTQMEELLWVSFNWALSGTDDGVDSLFESNIKFTLQQHPEISHILVIAPEKQTSKLKLAFPQVQIKNIASISDFDLLL